MDQRGPGGGRGKLLDDPRVRIHIRDVYEILNGCGDDRYDAILLDVDNGPIALGHAANNALYSEHGLAQARAALKPGGVLGVWSFGDDAA